MCVLFGIIMFVLFFVNIATIILKGESKNFSDEESLIESFKQIINSNEK